jgi:ornithine--oxo-acid transaminase
MRAGLATLQVLDDERLGARAAALGEYVRALLSHALSDYDMVRGVRGVGLLNGIEFGPPKNLRLRASYEAFRAIHPGLFGQMIVMRLFREKNILTQICGNNFMVLKVAPPLIVNEEEIDIFVRSVREVVEMVHTSGAFWSEALGLARRALKV